MANLLRTNRGRSLLVSVDREPNPVTSGNALVLMPLLGRSSRLLSRRATAMPSTITRQPQSQPSKKGKTDPGQRHHQPVGLQAHRSLPSQNCAMTITSAPNTSHYVVRSPDRATDRRRQNASGDRTAKRKTPLRSFRRCECGRAGISPPGRAPGCWAGCDRRWPARVGGCHRWSAAPRIRRRPSPPRTHRATVA